MKPKVNALPKYSGKGSNVVRGYVAPTLPWSLGWVEVSGGKEPKFHVVLRTGSLVEVVSPYLDSSEEAMAEVERLTDFLLDETPLEAPAEPAPEPPPERIATTPEEGLDFAFDRAVPPSVIGRTSASESNLRPRFNVGGVGARSETPAPTELIAGVATGPGPVATNVPERTARVTGPPPADGRWWLAHVRLVGPTDCGEEGVHERIRWHEGYWRRWNGDVLRDVRRLQSYLNHPLEVRGEFVGGHPPTDPGGWQLACVAYSDARGTVIEPILCTRDGNWAGRGGVDLAAARARVMGYFPNGFGSAGHTGQGDPSETPAPARSRAATWTPGPPPKDFLHYPTQYQLPNREIVRTLARWGGDITGYACSAGPIQEHTILCHVAVGIGYE